MSEHGELSLIEALAKRLPSGGPRVLMGIGDDAAVVIARPVCVTSVDAIVQGVHFELGEDRFSHADVGFKALGSALSDLAAMGVEPGEAYLVLGASGDLSHEDALAVLDGVSELAAGAGVSIAGGDVVGSPALSLCVTVVGWADSGALPVRRDGAAPGDIVGVTGELGGAGAGLALMRGDVDLRGQDAATALARARRPQPRLREGLALAKAGARAMIDLSDGLATDAAHVGRASGVLLDIDLSLLPLDRGVESAAAQLATQPWRLAACAGEDYELCFCVAPAERPKVERALAAAGGAPVRWIGEVLPAGGEDSGAHFRSEEGEVQMQGYEHRW